MGCWLCCCGIGAIAKIDVQEGYLLCVFQCYRKERLVGHIHLWCW